MQYQQTARSRAATQMCIIHADGVDEERVEDVRIVLQDATLAWVPMLRIAQRRVALIVDTKTKRDVKSVLDNLMYAVA